MNKTDQTENQLGVECYDVVIGCKGLQHNRAQHNTI